MLRKTDSTATSNVNRFPVLGLDVCCVGVGVSGAVDRPPYSLIGTASRFNIGCGGKIPTTRPLDAFMLGCD